MFYIQKKENTQITFSAITSNYNGYEHLCESPADRDAIKLLLLNEQGCLCPFCERRLDIQKSTIEHFLPKSTFPNLQLAYTNLFACCLICNGQKANHLIPAYIFDSRWDCTKKEGFITNRHQDCQIYHEPENPNVCTLSIPHLKKYPHKPNPQYYSDNILYSTISLLDLNHPVRLAEPRGSALNTLLNWLKKASKEALLALYERYSTPKVEIDSNNGVTYHQLEEYISMKLFYLGKEIQKRK